MRHYQYIAISETAPLPPWIGFLALASEQVRAGGEASSYDLRHQVRLSRASRHLHHDAAASRPRLPQTVKHLLLVVAQLPLVHQLPLVLHPIEIFRRLRRIVPFIQLFLKNLAYSRTLLNFAA